MKPNFKPGQFVIYNYNDHRTYSGDPNRSRAIKHQAPAKFISFKGDKTAYVEFLTPAGVRQRLVNIATLTKKEE